MAQVKPRLRFKREPDEQGLARVCQGPRGADLWYGGRDVGSVSPKKVGWGAGDYKGWYWCCPEIADLGIEHRNTSSAPVDTLEEAKAALRAHVEGCLKAKGLR